MADKLTTSKTIKGEDVEEPKPKRKELSQAATEEKDAKASRVGDATDWNHTEGEH